MNWGLFGLQQPLERGTFETKYKVHSVAFSKPELEGGGKIILPASALDQLARLNIDWPMLFQLSNPAQSGRRTHCGVLEFTSEEGHCYIPYWMMQLLLLEEGKLVNVKSATLPKGTFVKVQPHTSDFLDIANPRAVMENRFRNFSALTQGDVIKLEYNNKNYYLSIIEVRPSQPYNAISIIETDVEVDFAPPLDQPQETQPQKKVETSEPQQIKSPNTPAVGPVSPSQFQAFTGSGYKLNGKLGTSPASAPTSFTKSSTKKEEEEYDTDSDEETFKPFSGTGQKLKG